MMKCGINTCLLCLLLSCGSIVPDEPSGFIVRNVWILDGTGAPAYQGSVRVESGVIAAVGPLKPLAGERVIEGEGLYLAPGFIDTHSHADEELMQLPEALAAVSQGITTVVVGQDGESPLPLSGFFKAIEDKGVAVNVAAYSGFNSLRAEVLGDDVLRPAKPAERQAMAELLAADMRAGALGLSTGLEYEAAIAAPTEEVIALAQVAATDGGRYISHMRSEDRALEQSIDEVVAIGRATGMPVQISHLKLALRDLWGKHDRVLERLDAARREGIQISADVYPYEYWQANMMVVIPSKNLKQRDEFTFALEQLLPRDGFIISRYDADPSLVGKTLADIAAANDISMVDAYIELATLSRQYAGEGARYSDVILGASMTESDIHGLLRWPHTNICSDGSLDDKHPRGAGSFPRVLGRYVRDQRVIELAAAVHKMTGLSARHMGLTGRGVIRVGAPADLVLFDPATVADHATMENPSLPSVGIETVWVNGISVYNQKAATGVYPGTVVRRGQP